MRQLFTPLGPFRRVATGMVIFFSAATSFLAPKNALILSHRLKRTRFKETTVFNPIWARAHRLATLASLLRLSHTTLVKRKAGTLSRRPRITQKKTQLQFHGESPRKSSLGWYGKTKENPPPGDLPVLRQTQMCLSVSTWKSRPFCSCVLW